MKLYHITKARSIKSILENGLKTDTDNNGLTCGGDWKEYMYKRWLAQPIFLTSDVDYIVHNQLTDEWIKSNYPTVLEVNIEGLTVEWEYEYGNRATAYRWMKNLKSMKGDITKNTYVCYDDIGVDRIKIVDILEVRV